MIADSRASSTTIKGSAQKHHELSAADVRPPSLDFPESLRGKRIVLATESLGPVNGVSRTTQMLIDYLRDNGCDMAVVAPHYAKRRPFLKRSFLNRKNMKEVQELRLSGYPLPYNPDLTVVYPFRLDRIYSRTFGQPPDAIYLASPASVGFQFLLQLRQLENSPPVLLNFQTDLSSYSEILFAPPFDQYAVWILRMAQSFLFTHSGIHTVFYPSTMVQKYLVKAGISEKKMVRLGRGVDTEQFNPLFRDETYHKELAPNGEIVLISVARLAPEKGFKFLGKVGLKLKERGLKFRLLIVGGNKNPMVEDEVHRYFHPIQDNVTFTGFLTGDALARAYASADLFLHCSITETFGLVVLESMASGVPVIARDEGGPSDIVDEGNSGMLMPPHDIEAFVDCVMRVSTDSVTRNLMGVKARKQALATTWNAINNQVACQIADALTQRAAQPVVPARRRFITSRAGRQDLKRIIAEWFDAYAQMIRTSSAAIRGEAAIGIIFLFWNVAVIPLLLSGFLHSWLLTWSGGLKTFYESAAIMR